MRVLWLCNQVLPAFSRVFDIKKNPFEGWMTGMLEALSGSIDIDIALCFPIIDKAKLKDGIDNGSRYYSFLFERENQLDASSYENALEDRFEEIIDDYLPDIIHIWGTEYLHSLAMIRAAKKKDMINNVVVHIQGMVSVIADHFMISIPSDCFDESGNMPKSFRKELNDLRIRGINEIESIRESKIILGRTIWDKACTKWINPQRRYFHCGEILRKQFYEKSGTWVKQSNHRIFMSQGTDPIKGMHYIVRAVSKLASCYDDVELVVAGINPLERDTEYSKYLTELLEYEKVVDKVHFAGVLQADQMVEEYLKSNAFVLPSTIENSPNSLLEAMMIGVPVVTALVGGIQDIIRNSCEGLIYPFDEPDVMAYQISRVFDEEIDLDMLSKQETKRALEFAPGDSAVDLINIYRNIAQRNNIC